MVYNKEDTKWVSRAWVDDLEKVGGEYDQNTSNGILD